MVKEIQPLDLRRLIEAKLVTLIDVREQDEYDLVRLPNSFLVPLNQLPTRLEEIKDKLLDKTKTAVVYCRSGARSQLAIDYLAKQMDTELLNLRGGINAYAKEADSNYQPY